MSKHDETHAALLALVQRYLGNRDEFTAARAVRLPADKAAFPRLVVLDMNHWIALARVHYGKSHDAGAAAALAALRAASQAGRVLVPVTDINLGETLGIPQEDRRRRLATFMVELSRNYSLAGHLQVEPFEVANALATEFASIEARWVVRPSLVRWGVLHAMAVAPLTVGNPHLDALINEVLDYPERSINTMVHGHDAERERKAKAREEHGMRQAAAIRALDQNMDANARHRLELSNLNTNVIDRLLPEVGIDPMQFYAWLREEPNCMRFWHAIPGTDVLMTLLLERDKNRDAKTHRNDSRDVSLMKVAIPYANIAVLENLWSHLANSTGLAAKYGTTVISDLAQLPDLIRAEGCL
jgi:hypothetical protein